MGSISCSNCHDKHYSISGALVYEKDCLTCQCHEEKKEPEPKAPSFWTRFDKKIVAFEKRKQMRIRYPLHASAEPASIENTGRDHDAEPASSSTDGQRRKIV